MSCKINRHATTGKIEEVLTEGHVPSELFTQIKTHVSDEYLALKLWAATNTPTFKAEYGSGTRSAIGEPILTSISPKVLGFVSPSGTPIVSFIADIAEVATNEKGNLELISEAYTNNPDWFDKAPMSIIQEKIFLSNQDVVAEMGTRHRAVFNTVAKNRRRFESSSTPTGTIFRLRESSKIPGITYRGAGFNGDGLSQYLKQGYKASDWDPSKTYGENRADQEWKDLDSTSSKLIGRVIYKNKAEFIAEKNENEAWGILNGNVKHKYDEWIHSTPGDRIRIRHEIDRMVAEAKASGLKVEKGYMSFMEKIAPAILSREGINNETVVFHEVPFANDVLGLNGRIDKMIVYPDGYVSLREIKTSGRIVKNEFINLFKYGYKGYMEANKLNEAKVQLMLYALSMAIENPLAKFTNLGIDLYTDKDLSVSEANNISLSKEDVSRILDMLKEMFKAESEIADSPIKDIQGRLEAFKAANPSHYKSIFDVNTYVNTPSITTEQIIKKGAVQNVSKYGENTIEAAQEAVKQLKLDLGIYYNLDTYKKEAYEKGNMAIRGKYEAIHGNVQKFVSIMSGGGLATDIWMKDLSYLNFIVGGTTSNVRNPLAAVYNEYFHAQMAKATKDYNNDMDRMYQYLLPVVNKFLQTRGQKPIERLDEKMYGIFMRQDFMRKNITEVWQQFWTDSTVEGQSIRHRKRAEEFNEGTPERALAAFLDDYYAKWLKEDDSFVNRNATYKKSKGGKGIELITHLDVYNGKGEGSEFVRTPFSYKSVTTQKSPTGEEVFIPYNPAVPKMPHEAEAALEGAGIKTSKFKQYFVKFFTDFVDQYVNQPVSDNTLMVPMRYLGQAGQDGSKFSEDLAWSFSMFSKNMNNKVHLDDAMAVAEGIALHLESMNEDRDEKERVRLLIKFVRDLGRYQNKGQLPKDDFIANVRRTTSDLFRIPIKHYVADRPGEKAKEVEYIVTLHTLLRGLRSMTSHVIMTLSPIGASYNAIQAIFSSVKAGWSGKAGNYLIKGVDEEAYDFNASGYIEGIKEWKKMQESAIGGNAEASKLFLIARELNYLPKNVEYFDLQEQSITSPMKFLSSSSLMFMHTAAEEMNTMAILYAQLKNMKVTVTKNGVVTKVPIYDCYKLGKPIVENGITRHTVEWDMENIGMRGYERVGDTKVPIYGLQPKEVIKLKRVYERLQGNYRREEKSWVELYALGQVFLQFKRFLPSMIRNQWQGRRVDTSLGKYILEKDANGEDVMRWKERMIAGKYYVLFNYFAGGILAPLMKKIPGNIRNKASFEFREGYRWSEMEPDEQVQVIDSIITLGIMMALTGGSWLKSEDDGKKDTLATVLMKLGETVAQPWSILQTLSAVKGTALGGASVNMLFNQTSAIVEMFAAEAKYWTGITDSPYNSDDHLPGFRKFARNVPLGRAISDIINFKNNLADQERGNR